MGVTTRRSAVAVAFLNRSGARGHYLRATTANARQILGRRGEQLALEHYQRLGFELLSRNHCSAIGELDLVVADARTIVFVEVKTSSTSLDPLVSINPRKLARMRRLAAGWLSSVPTGARRPAIRLDVVAITLDRRGELVALDQFADVT